MDLAGFYFKRFAETIYRHLQHPAKKVNEFPCLPIVSLESKIHQLNFEGCD